MSNTKMTRFVVLSLSQCIEFDANSVEHLFRLAREQKARPFLAIDPSGEPHYFPGCE